MANYRKKVVEVSAGVREVFRSFGRAGSSDGVRVDLLEGIGCGMLRPENLARIVGSF